MTTFSLTIESDNPDRMQTLVALAHILLEGHKNAQPVYPYLEEIEFFIQMTAIYLDNVELVSDDFDGLMKIGARLEELAELIRTVTSAGE